MVGLRLPSVKKGKDKKGKIKKGNITKENHIGWTQDEAQAQTPLIVMLDSLLFSIRKRMVGNPLDRIPYIMLQYE